MKKNNVVNVGERFPTPSLNPGVSTGGGDRRYRFKLCLVRRSPTFTKSRKSFSPKAFNLVNVLLHVHQTLGRKLRGGFDFFGYNLLIYQKNLKKCLFLCVGKEPRGLKERRACDSQARQRKSPLLNFEGKHDEPEPFSTG